MKCLDCGYNDEFRSSRFDYEREMLEAKHFDRVDERVRSILDELLFNQAIFASRFYPLWRRWNYPTLQRFGFAWTMTSTGTALWRMALETWKTRGWSPKGYFDSSGKTWTVRRNPKLKTA